MRECARSHRSLSPIDSFTHRFAPKLQKHPSTHARSFPPSSLFSLLRPSLRRRLAPRCRRRRRAAVGRSVYGRLRARPCARLPLRRRRRRSVRGLSLASVSATLQIALRPSASLRARALPRSAQQRCRRHHGRHHCQQRRERGRARARRRRRARVSYHHSATAPPPPPPPAAVGVGSSLNRWADEQ